MDDRQDAGFKPPYGSFRTFWGFVAALAEKPLPPQIDRSMLDSKSGTDQLAIFSALKAFNLVAGDAQLVQPELTDLVRAGAEGRKKQLASLLHTYYPGQIDVSAQQGTEKMLLDSFEKEFGLTGDTRRKAATWFLHAANECGLPMSPHFPKLRPGQGGPSAPRPKRAPKKRVPDGTTPVGREDPATTGTTADEVTVKLRAGGSVTLKVNVGHIALSRNKADRTFVEGLLDALTAYEEKSAREAAPSLAEVSAEELDPDDIPF